MTDELEGASENEPTLVHDDQLYDVVKDLRFIKNYIIYSSIAWVIALLAMASALDSQ